MAWQFVFQLGSRQSRDPSKAILYTHFSECLAEMKRVKHHVGSGLHWLPWKTVNFEGWPFVYIPGYSYIGSLTTSKRLWNSHRDFDFAGFWMYHSAVPLLATSDDIPVRFLATTKGPTHDFKLYEEAKVRFTAILEKNLVHTSLYCRVEVWLVRPSSLVLVRTGADHIKVGVGRALSTKRPVPCLALWRRSQYSPSVIT